nr:unnamed protein product [Callosobruchus chinensis]
MVHDLRQQKVNNHIPTKLRVDANCVLEFSPEKSHLLAMKWLDKIEQLDLINGWDDAIKIYVMQLRIGGLAKNWYEDLDNYHLQWDEWKAWVLKSFPDNSDSAAINRSYFANGSKSGKVYNVRDTL